MLCPCSESSSLEAFLFASPQSVVKEELCSIIEVEVRVEEGRQGIGAHTRLEAWSRNVSEGLLGDV